MFGVSVLHQRSGADNPPFWPGEWGGGGRHPWDGRFPSANSEPSLSAQLPTGASANRSRVLIPTFLQPSPAATPGLGTSMTGRQSAPSCLPEEWWAERRVVWEWGRTDYGEELPPEAEGGPGPGRWDQAAKEALCRWCSPSSPPRALLTVQITAAQALPAPTPAPEGARQKPCSRQPPLWEVLLAPGRKGLGRPQLPAQCLEGNQEQGKNKGGGGWGHPVSPPRAGPLWLAE